MRKDMHMTVHSPLVPFPKKRKSPPLTPEMAARIKALLNYGLSQQDIATMTGVNQGRVSEVNTGMKFPGISPCQLEFAF
jgi:DNA invertase Pin-like site-specific DNA recombinase